MQRMGWVGLLKVRGYRGCSGSVGRAKNGFMIRCDFFSLFVCNHIVLSHLMAMTNSLIPSPLVNTQA
jgi:hypothetical protein